MSNFGLLRLRNKAIRGNHSAYMLFNHLSDLNPIQPFRIAEPPPIDRPLKIRVPASSHDFGLKSAGGEDKYNEFVRALWY